MAKTQDFEFRYAACRGRHSLQTDYGRPQTDELRLRAVRMTTLLLRYKYCGSETDVTVDALLARSRRNTGKASRFERSGLMTGSIPSWVLSRALDLTDSQS